MTLPTRDLAPVRTCHGRPRLADAARFGLGVTALTQPRMLLHAAGSADAIWPRRIIRLLGARYVAQSVTGMVVHDRRILLGDAVVEVAHALTTIAFASSFPRYRTLAVTNGAVAVGFAIADLRAFAVADHTRRAS